MFSAKNNISIGGVLYKDYFNPYDSVQNMLADGFSFSSEFCSYNFLETIHLQSNTTYKLFVSTYFPDNFGAFSVTVYGPARIIVSHVDVGMYMINL